MAFDPSRYKPHDRVHLPDRTWPDRALERAPIWCSVDLRDGNQALPDPMGHDRKSALLALLVKVGFKEIEIGFPSASQTDFDFARWVVDTDALPSDVTLQVLTQARESLIRRTFAAIAGARRAIVHLYNSTSELQRRVVFGMSRRQVVDLAVQHTRIVRSEAERLPRTAVTLEYSPESFTGTELDFALEICDAVVEAWDATPERKVIINLPSTVETTTPNVFADRIEWMHRNLARRDAVVLSVHTHNDRGTGVASSELAVLAGAERVEGTLLGNGERSGNVDIVNLALNLYAQGVHPGLVFDDLPELVRIVKECTRLPVHPRHPYAGELIFAAFSGSHQDAIHKGMKAMQSGAGRHWEVPYLPIDPADVGREYEPVIRINSQSGKSGIAHVLERDYGYRLPRSLAVELSQHVQALTDAGEEELSPAAVLNVFEAAYLRPPGPLALKSYGIERRSAGLECGVTARVLVAGQERDVSGVADGPIEAFARALETITLAEFDILDYSEHARGVGAHADAIAYVALRTRAGSAAGAPVYHGAGCSGDVVLASFLAIIAALNRRSSREGLAEDAAVA